MTLTRDNSKQNGKFTHTRSARSSLKAEKVVPLYVMQTDVVSQLPPSTLCKQVCLKFPLFLGAFAIVQQLTQLLQFSLQVFMASKGSCPPLRHVHQHGSHHKLLHTRDCSLIVEWLAHERRDLSAHRIHSLHRYRGVVGRPRAFTSGVSSFTDTVSVGKCARILPHCLSLNSERET